MSSLASTGMMNFLTSSGIRAICWPKQNLIFVLGRRTPWIYETSPTSNVCTIQTVTLKFYILDWCGTRMLMWWNSLHLPLNHPLCLQKGHSSRNVQNIPPSRDTQLCHRPRKYIDTRFVKKNGYDWDTSLPLDIVDQWSSIATSILPWTLLYSTYMLHARQQIPADASARIWSRRLCHFRERISCRSCEEQSCVGLGTPTPTSVLVAARKAQHVNEAFPVTKIACWSDSQIVLHWLKRTKPLKRFMANWVAEIKKWPRNWHSTMNGDIDIRRKPSWFTDTNSFSTTIWEQFVIGTLTVLTL